MTNIETILQFCLFILIQYGNLVSMGWRFHLGEKCGYGYPHINQIYKQTNINDISYIIPISCTGKTPL